MAEFAYKAASTVGGVTTGKVTAETREAALSSIRGRGLLPLEIREVAPRNQIPIMLGRGRLRRMVVLRFAEKLSGLLSAGVPLDRSLAVMASGTDDRTDDSVFGQTVAAIRRKVQDGSSLADALAASRHVLFPEFYIGAVRAGEASGALSEVLSRLSDFLQRQEKLRRDLVASLVYPAITLLFAGVAILVLVTVLVPSFAVLLADTGQALPAPTKALVWLGRAIRGYWWAVLSLGAAAVAGLDLARRSGDGRMRLEAALLRIPGYGGIRRAVASARLLRTLAVLLLNGVPLLDALGVSVEAAGNPVLRVGMLGAIAGVKEGRSLSSELGTLGFLSRASIQIVQIGEEIGTLAQSLEKAGADMERQAQSQIGRALAILEPALLVVTAGVVAFVALSMLLPILSLNTLGSLQR